MSDTCPEGDIKIIRFPPNCTLLPGFIDCHVHLTIFSDDYQVDYLRLSSADKALRGLKAAQGLLQAGFTTIRSAGDADDAYPSFSIAKSIAEGIFEGPRIVGAGHYISVTGGGGDLNFIAAEHTSSCPCNLSDGLIANGKEEMVLAVRKEIKYGSDWIKLLVTGAFMSASTGPKDSPENTHFSDEELIACVEEARRRQVPVMAHAHGADGIVRAARLGCRSIEHASFIDQDGIDACLAADCWIVPTFLVGEYYNEAGSPSHAQERMIELQRNTNARYYSCIQSAVKANVKVALGSDFVGWDPKITAREFRHLVELGQMSPHDAILAGTSSAAELLGLPQLGRIASNCVADMVVVRGDPISDISALEKDVVFVMKSGKVVRNDLEVTAC
eukprot:CAMPEP_0114472510 /NCGR_PEP_ID=MMETSP0104-20121206/12430_1 /TAXON_ID=37642 ORGANISM="Paraphysomonas imperforata, Strain PA2" /NCGR_SAMPLE_ID=MMETSP0104 /ASSEMBLY_ACC=CAM_ASM_000202 /LENGTH=387 /DNA_ID=CAMNT_0001646519 /DNA_START=148 /DNA_END=1311 /DNA_ORIENTATION=-